MSTSLHLKYRPQHFDDVLGQDLVTDSLKKVIAQRVAHAFIFTGESGVGKTTLARIVAAKLGCTQSGLLELDAATHSGADEMRQVAEDVKYKPLDGTARVVIVDEAHVLSKTAWQTLLKPIEEPPGHVFWILCTTDPSKIPTTISTRCVSYALKPVKPDLLFALLQVVAEEEGYDTTEDILYLIAEESFGSPRQALTNLVQCHACENVKDAAKTISAVLEEGDDATIELCRALVKGLTWSTAKKLLVNLAESNPESVRLVILAYMTTVLLKTESQDTAGKLVEIMDCFSQPYEARDKMAPLILSLARVMWND